MLSGCRVAARRRARAVSSARRRARAVSSTEQLGRASRAFLLLQTPSVHASRARCARMHECADRCLLDAAGDASCRALRPWMPATPQSTTANESPPGTVARPGDASGHCSLAPAILEFACSCLLVSYWPLARAAFAFARLTQPGGADRTRQAVNTLPPISSSTSPSASLSCAPTAQSQSQTVTPGAPGSRPPTHRSS